MVSEDISVYHFILSFFLYLQTLTIKVTCLFLSRTLKRDSHLQKKLVFFFHYRTFIFFKFLNVLTLFCSRHALHFFNCCAHPFKLLSDSLSLSRSPKPIQVPQNKHTYKSFQPSICVLCLEYMVKLRQRSGLRCQFGKHHCIGNQHQETGQVVHAFG